LGRVKKKGVSASLKDKETEKSKTRIDQAGNSLGGARRRARQEKKIP